MAAALLSFSSTLPRNRCIQPLAPARSQRAGRKLRVVSALPGPLANLRLQEDASKAGKAALIAVVLSTGMSLAPPEAQLLQPAAASGHMYHFDVPPEQPQLKTEGPPPAAPQLPNVPAPELPKSKMPEAPKFSMPSRPPVQPPPGPSMSAPKDIPKTESPALPVPAPEVGKPAPPPAQKTASSAAPSQQGFNWDDFAKGPSKPNTSPFSTAEPEKKQSQAQAPVSKETKERLAQQAKQQAAPADKRKSKRHGPPLFLVQLLLTVGIVAALAAAVIKYDTMMAGATKLEKALIRVCTFDDGLTEGG